MNSELKPSKILFVCIGFNTKKCNTNKIGVKILESIFGSYGQLSKILIFSRKHLLKAFVEFEKLESARKAVSSLNNTILPLYGKMTVFYAAIESISIDNSKSEHKIFKLPEDEDVCARVSMSTFSDYRSRSRSPQNFNIGNVNKNLYDMSLFTPERKIKRPVLEKGVNFRPLLEAQENTGSQDDPNIPKINEPSKVVLVSNISDLFETKLEMFNLFSYYGNIKKLILMRNLGKALVEYVELASAALCIKSLHCTKVGVITLKVNYSRYESIDLTKNNKNMNSINYNEAMIVPFSMHRYRDRHPIEPKSVSSNLIVVFPQSEKVRAIDIYLLIEKVAKPDSATILKESTSTLDKQARFQLCYSSMNDALLVIKKLHNKLIGTSSLSVEFN